MHNWENASTSQDSSGTHWLSPAWGTMLMSRLLPPQPLAEANLCGLQVATLLTLRTWQPAHSSLSHLQVRLRRAQTPVPCSCYYLCPEKGAHNSAWQAVKSDTEARNYLHREEINYVFQVS